MMTDAYRSLWLLLAPCLLVGCTWTNTVWLIPEDETKSSAILLIDPQKRPGESPFALLEAKAIKTWDSPGDLIGSNIKEAKGIGAKSIWCPPFKEDQANLLSLPAVIPGKEEIGLLKEFLIAVTDLLKAVIALPVTWRSEAVSKKTLLCAVYRKDDPSTTSTRR